MMAYSPRWRRERGRGPGGGKGGEEGGLLNNVFLQRGSSPRSDLLNLLYTNFTEKVKSNPFVYLSLKKGTLIKYTQKNNVPLSNAVTGQLVF